MARIVCVVLSSLFTFILSAQSIRSVDGSFNNVFNPDWGSEGSELSRITDIGFADGISEMGGVDRPNPRHISNLIFEQDDPIYDILNLSDFTWVFGQFIDHDITLVENDPTEPLFIEIPQDDEVFTPGARPMTMFRSAALKGSGTDVNNPRRYVNSVTAYIDGSTIYGSDGQKASWLRTHVNGKLKTSTGNLLPWNTKTGEFNDPKDPDAPFMADDTHTAFKLFVSGDIRANENPLLLAFHTLFMREHNRLCDKIIERNPDLTDEEVYQKARLWVGAFIQSITYNEWLPAQGLIIPKYNGYRREVNPQITNVFSAAAFRMGHTLINSNVLRLEKAGDDIPSGSVSLRDAFFNPAIITLAGGIEPYLRGMASQVQQQLDCKVIDDIRNFLFGSPASGGLDLAAININRGRERGLPDYNTIRKNIGLPGISNFNEITSDVDVQDELRILYQSWDNIDPWVGMLAEENMPEAIFGNTIMAILEKQFRALRDGDRFYFETDPRFSPEDREEIANTTMRDIIMRNTSIEIMQENVFEAKPRTAITKGPELERVSLAAQAYPNPSDGNFTIKVFANSDFDASIRIYDLHGRLLSNSQFPLVKGDNFIPVQVVQDFEGGVYNIVIEKDRFEYTILRVIKQ